MVKKAHSQSTKKKIRSSASGKKQTRKIIKSKKHKQSKGGGPHGEILSTEQQIGVLGQTQTGILETLKKLMLDVKSLQAYTREATMGNVDYVQQEIKKIYDYLSNFAKKEKNQDAQNAKVEEEINKLEKRINALEQKETSADNAKNNHAMNDVYPGLI